MNEVNGFTAYIPGTEVPIPQLKWEKTETDDGTVYIADNPIGRCILTAQGTDWCTGDFIGYPGLYLISGCSIEDAKRKMQIAYEDLTLKMLGLK